MKLIYCFLKMQSFIHQLFIDYSMDIIYLTWSIILRTSKISQGVPANYEGSPNPDFILESIFWKL